MPFLSSRGRRMVFREDIPPRALPVTSLPRHCRGTFPTLQMWSSREIWSWEQSLVLSLPWRGCWQGLGAVGRGSVPIDSRVLVLAGSSLAEESAGERMELSGVIKSLCPSEQTVPAYTIIALGFSPGCHGAGWRQL